MIRHSKALAAKVKELEEGCTEGFEDERKLSVLCATCSF